MTPPRLHKNLLLNLLYIILICLSSTLSGSAFANSGAKEDGGGGNMTKLEAFTVNLSTSEKYLQVSMTLQLANPEIAEKIKVYLPVVRHVILMSLSGKEPGDILSSAGKKELIEEIRDTVNKALDVKEHDGVTNIFFENFVIQ
ncbi:flagellar FliL protein [Undibacterium sp. GrIS 1.8]|uniref:flagellar basal body-associated FliL family protein n=1 Tax=Undibacterium sp. GrIS 1.8 TaxID=3143934 RepID=UPI0033938857